MLIESKFHDYYDSIKAFGVDKTCVYKRHTEEFKMDNKLFEPTTKYGNPKGGELPPLPGWEEISLGETREHITARVYKHLLGFCGQIFPYMYFDLDSYWNNMRRPEDRFQSEVAYTYEEALDYLQGNNARLGNGRYVSYRNRMSLKTAQGIKEFFDYDWSRYQRYFVEHKVPCFRVHDHKNDYGTFLELNPQLKPLRFMKVRDPATSFQEIYMYIAGTLGLPERPMIEIEDKYKQQQHGHDHRYSFRREPTKRKPK